MIVDDSASAIWGKIKIPRLKLKVSLTLTLTAGETDDSHIFSILDPRETIY